MKEVNLLPKIRQRELAYLELLRSLYTAVWIAAASFILVFLVQVGVKLFLQHQLAAAMDQVAQLKTQVDKQENAQIKTQIQLINSRIGDYKHLADSIPKWSNVLRAFSVLPPDGVKINSLNLNFSQKSVAITGFAPTRDLVIALYNNIKQDDQEFYNIDYPLENVVKASNVNFHFTFYIQDSLLK